MKSKKQKALRTKNRLVLIISLSTLALILIGVVTYQWILNKKDVETTNNVTEMAVGKWISDNIFKTREPEDTTDTNNEDNTNTGTTNEDTPVVRVVKEYSYTSTHGDSMKVLVSPDSSDYYKYNLSLRNITKNSTKEIITMYGDNIYIAISPTFNYILAYDDAPAESPTTVYVFDENGGNLYSSDADKNIWEYIYDNSDMGDGMTATFVKGWIDSSTCRFELSNEEVTVTASLQIPTLKMTIEK